MNLAQIRQKTLELLGDAAEGSSTFAPSGDYTKLDAAIQWAQEQAASTLGSIFYFESALPVVAQAPPTGMPTTPGAFGGVAIPSDCIELVRVAVGTTTADLVMPLLFVDGIGGIVVPLIPYNASDTGVWSSPDSTATFLSTSGTWALVDSPNAGGTNATVRLTVTSGTYIGNIYTASAPCWNVENDFSMEFSDTNPTPGETGITVTGENCGYPGGTLNGTEPEFMTWSVSSNCTITDGQNTDVLTISVNEDVLPGDTISVDLLYKIFVPDPENPGGNWTVYIASTWSAPTGSIFVT